MKQKQLPVSDYQRRFFLEWMIDPNGCEYNQCLIFRMSGKLNKKNFKQACAIFIQANEMVGTRYSPDGKKSYVVSTLINDFYQEITLSNNQKPKSYIRHLISKAFDLTKGQLLRLHLLEVNSSLHYFVLCVHHIIADAVFADIFIADIVANYNLLEQNVKITVTASRFIEAIKAEQKFTKQASIKLAQEFWAKQLDNIPLHLDLPKKINDSQALSLAKEIYFDISHQDLINLKLLGRECKGTIFTVLAALYGFILAKFSATNKLVIAYPVNLRQPGFANIAGSFVNNLPLVIDLDGKTTIVDLITNILEQRLKAKKHQWYLLTNIIDEERKQRHEYNTRTWLNVSISEANLNIGAVNLDGLSVTTESISPKIRGIYQLSFAYDLRAVDGGIRFRLQYQSAAIDTYMANDIAKKLKRLIKTAYKNRFLSLAKISLLTNNEYQKIVRTWNNRESQSLNTRTIIELLKEQVEVNQHKIALIYKNQKLSYKDLDQRSSQLASYIKSNCQQIKRNSKVMLYLDRSMEMIVAIIAVLKIGATYVPVALDTPREQVANILAAIKARLILTKKQYSKQVGAFIFSNDSKNLAIPSVQVLTIDLTGNDIYATDNNITANHVFHDYKDSLAYIIYTSGTTGLSKGVMVKNSDVSAFARDTTFLNYQKIHNVLGLSSFAFDGSIFDVFVPLLNGATLTIADKLTYLDVLQLTKTVKDNKIDTVFITTAMLNALLLNDNIGVFDGVKQLLFGGEKCEIAIINKFKLFYPNTRLIHVYGPTETVVFTTYCDLSDYDTRYVAPIGKVLDNKKIYILDHDLQPVPIGVAGEIYIGGSGIALGYLGMPKLTKERFIVDIIGEDKNSKLYKTGDLARYLPDGNIDYIGRIDTQVKLRGYRVELSAVENSMSKFPGVVQACVIMKNLITSNTASKANAGSLLAYYVAREKLDENALIQHLKNSLPEYMVPNILLRVKQIPLTANGKLDKNNLPAPIITTTNCQNLPKTIMEKQLAKAWQDGLDVERIAVNDDFFKIGGNSILAMQVIYLINKILKTTFTVADMFQLRTIENFIAAYQKQQTKSLLRQLNVNKQSKSQVFFIHPGGAGVEVYYQLAIKLNINAWGIDNYNIACTDKIADLSQLAQKYLQLIMPVITKDVIVHFCGWSFGGQIALAMAKQLELQGFKSLKVVLLDTYILKNRHFTTKQLLAELNLNTNLHSKTNSPLANNDYLRNLKKTLNCERKMATVAIAGKLKYTEVLLFRAEELSVDDNKMFAFCHNFSCQYLPTSHFAIIPYITQHFNEINFQQFFL